jgi:caa(3)-type oxidase subunit IV
MQRGVLRPVHHLLTFGALVALATASLIVGTRVHWRYGSTVVSLGIAVGKALLVLWVFMHMREQSFRARVGISVAVVLLALLVGLTAADVATRQEASVGPRPQPAEQFYVR